MFTVIHSGIFVGVGALDDPKCITNLINISIENHTFVDRILGEFFNWDRVAEGVDPYNRKKIHVRFTRVNFRLSSLNARYLANGSSNK